MKFRVKIDTPWADKGTIFISTRAGHYRPETASGYLVEKNPEFFPEVFEAIEEKPEVEVLADWLVRADRKCSPAVGTFWNIAQALIDAGVDVSKITKGELMKQKIQGTREKLEIDLPDSNKLLDELTEEAQELGFYDSEHLKSNSEHLNKAPNISSEHLGEECNHEPSGEECLVGGHIPPCKKCAKCGEWIKAKPQPTKLMSPAIFKTIPNFFNASRYYQSVDLHTAKPTGNGESYIQWPARIVIKQDDGKVIKGSLYFEIPEDK